ncbi:MAG: GNAT family N-acetyltransferase, partial [Vicinamibacterales bacterium]
MAHRAISTEPRSRSCAGRVFAVPVLEQALLVERHHAEWFVAEGAVPGTEVHRDRDVTWLVHPGDSWRNAGIMVRFRSSTAARRLDTLIERYRGHGRGMALWIAPGATPDNLRDLLEARKLRCQKYYPAMVRSLSDTRPAEARPAGFEIGRVKDATVFEKTPHPSIGAITTPLRRQALDRLRSLISSRSERTVAFVAWLEKQPVGACEVFHGSEVAGLHSLTVPDEHRGRGIGAALVEHACRHAVQRGASTMVLLASSDGQRLYERCGFEQVARFGYWYR